MAVLVGLLLCGLMCVSIKVEATTFSTIGDQLRPAAISYTGPLPCKDWDCDCTFNRQRGCCCAADDMFNLEDETFTRVKSLWYSIQDMAEEVENCIAARKISFKATINQNIASLISGTSDHCFGPFNSNVPIPFGTVTLNEGNGYNPTLGIFTAPRAGVYVFSFTVYSSVSSNERLYHKVQLMKDGLLVTGVWENNREDFEDNGTQLVILELETGTQVYLELVSGRKLCTYMDRNIFTGFMLYS